MATTHLRLVLGAATLAVAALGMGCDRGGSTLCGPVDGEEGPCCVITLPGGETVSGACLDGRCRRADQPGLSPPCGESPPGPEAPDSHLVDAQGLDMARSDRGAGDGDAAADGGLDGAPSDTMAADLALDMAAGLCDDTVCEPGERCDPATGACVSRRLGIPGGPCESTDDCQAGVCLSEAESGGAVPGGFCAVPCDSNIPCGRGACLEAVDGPVCFEPCDDRGGCRPGWSCRPVPGRAEGVCQLDCRVVGCPGQGRCDSETGACGPVAIECRYPCEVGESCEDGRCVRLDGTCETDYHCPLAEESCFAGRCSPLELTRCLDDGGCGPRQRCAAIDGGGGCLFACEVDSDCPPDRACRADLGVCDRVPCGAGTGNGALLGGCRLGAAARAGTCIPVESRPPGDPTPGFCVEAGILGADEPCDAQSRGRAVADRALQCASGLLCRDDPDDPLDPRGPGPGRGRCVALCEPGGAPCLDPLACVNFGAVDDPDTVDDEGRTIGLCLEVECVVLAGECPREERCRAHGLTDPAGTCGPAGRIGAGGPCGAVDDCADEALCVFRGEGTVCLAICDPEAPAACGGGLCYSEPGWGYGLCL